MSASTRIRLFSIWAFLCLLGFAALARGEDEACTITDKSTGRFYDLRPLAKDNGEYTARDDATGDVYKLNVCGPIRTGSGKLSSEMGISREERRGNIQSAGTYTSRPHISHDVLSLSYAGGDTCPEQPGIKMGSVIAFVCDHNVYGVGQPEFVTSLNGCSFFFYWRTQYACSTTGSKGIGSAIGAAVSTIFILFLFAVAGIVLYNRFVLKKTGREQFPVLGPSILDAWHFIKDMVLIADVTVWDKANDLIGRGTARRGGFQGLPTDGP